MRKIIMFIAALISLIGVAHIIVTPLTYKTFTIDAMWFAALGLALIFLAFLHFILLIGEKRTLFFIFGYIGNGLAIIFFSLILSLVVTPNVILLFVLVLLQTVLFIYLQCKSNK